MMKLEVPQKQKSFYLTKIPLNVRVKSGQWKQSTKQIVSQLRDVVK